MVAAGPEDKPQVAEVYQGSCGRKQSWAPRNILDKGCWDQVDGTGNGELQEVDESASM